MLNTRLTVPVIQPEDSSDKEMTDIEVEMSSEEDEDHNLNKLLESYFFGLVYYFLFIWLFFM